MAEIHYAGLKDGGTFYLDNTTATAIKADPESIIGKAVTWVDGTGEPMVGYGVSATNGSPIAGIVISVDKANEWSTGNDPKDWTVGITWHETYVDVPTPQATETAIAGGWIGCNNKGEVVKCATATNARCLSVGGSPKKCVIKID